MKTPDGDEYRFELDAYSPTTIPMARLAEYMTALAKFLANAEYVHFERLEPGSTVLVSRVEREASPKVAERIRAVRAHSASDDVQEAFNVIDFMARRDNAVAKLARKQPGERRHAVMLKFPGRESMLPVKVGPFMQPTIIDGRVVRVGGRGMVAHAQIEDAEGRTFNGDVSRDIAKQLGAKLYEILRFSGDGKWERTESGKWELEQFRINSFIALPTDTLADAIIRLRRIEGSEWTSTTNPEKLIHDLRKDDDES